MLCTKTIPIRSNPTTTIRYDLPEDAQVYLVIYNILGQEVTTLISEKQPAGFHRIIWDSKNQFGKPVSPGIYFYLLKTNHFSDSKKLVFLKIVLIEHDKVHHRFFRQCGKYEASLMYAVKRGYFRLLSYLYTRSLSWR